MNTPTNKLISSTNKLIINLALDKILDVITEYINIHDCSILNRDTYYGAYRSIRNTILDAEENDISYVGLGDRIRYIKDKLDVIYKISPPELECIISKQIDLFINNILEICDENN